MNKTSNIILRLTVVFTLVILSLLAILKIGQHAYIYVGFGWLAITSVYIWKSRSEKQRLIAIYTGSIFLAFFLGELYFSGILGFRYQEASFEKEVIYGGLDKPHEILGQAPVPNSRWSSKYIYADSTVFDVIQTIDSMGLRLTPGGVRSDASPILFLGCSFTFGTGLGDHETLPYFFQAQSASDVKAINMAYNGYGAHQMLAILEEELEQTLLKSQIPKAAIYSAIPDHAFRGTLWREEAFGPRYVFDRQGDLIKEGTFQYNPSSGFKLLAKSHLARRFVFRRDHSKPDDINIFIAMVKKSSQLFAERYNAPFYCLLWDELNTEPGLYNTILTLLKKSNINVIEIKDILPNYKETPEKYLLYGDNHPNALANRLISEYLSELILTENP